jgi:ribosomal protein S17E
MSNMLKQAIADAAALREQAIKNAEQSVIEKYSQQIKEAVDQMLEVDASSNLDRAKSTIKEIEENYMRQ